MTPRSRVDSMLVGALNRTLNEKRAELKKLTDGIARAEVALASMEADLTAMRVKAEALETDISEIQSRLGTMRGGR